MYLLDNDTLKLVVTGEGNITRRIAPHLSSVWISSVTAEELLVAHMNAINRARSPRNSLSLPRAYTHFAQALEDIRLFPLLISSDEADAVYRTFPPAITRIGPQDCRIAAQAIAHGMIVLTRNLRDFQAIGAACEDWSAPVPFT